MSNQSKRGLTGVACGIDANVRSIIQARRELARLGRSPRPMSNHDTEVSRRVANGNFQYDVWFVLMDCSNSEQLKRKAMTRLEASRRNKALAGTGFAWAMVGSG
jgi:hypothetical protein